MDIRDNTWKKIDKSTFVQTFPKLSERLLDKTLKYLSKQENLFIFPNDFQDTPDLSKNQKVFETYRKYIRTQNVIGFLGCGDEQLTIRSRFSQGNDDYFLHYMLQKVLNINIVDFSIGLSLDDQIYQLLIYFFPKYLQNAMRKGLYKQYQHFSYNNHHPKGPINIAQHIKLNTPFTGRIACDTRELTYDNAVMQLVRHTIEKIKSSQQGGTFFWSSQTLREQVQAVISATPSYQLSDRQRVIHQNQTTPVRHAYYHEYRELQKLCLMILAYRQHSFNKDSNKVYGILFDVAWLWEEYIATLLPEFKHPKNKSKKGGISVFSRDCTRKAYPDFYSREKKVVLDAKYKKEKDEEKTQSKSIPREDLYQLIAYSHILSATSAGLIYPNKDTTTELTHVGQLNGYGGTIFKIEIQIPQGVSTYTEFQSSIENSESTFQEEILKYMQNIQKS